MEFDKSFFEDEIRDGFYVSAEMKHAWAAQLEVLNDVDKACKENGIQYFAEWGTLLGAVRHHGFIPWDDDMDICMKRPDFNKFVKNVKNIMPEGYQIYNIESDKDNDNLLARIISGRTIDFSAKYLDKYHGFPYVAGIDIFPLDFIAPDREEDDYLCTVIDIVNTVAKFMRMKDSENEAIEGEDLEKLNSNLLSIEQLCGVRIDREKDIIQQLNILVDQLCSLYTEDETEELTIRAIWQKNKAYKFRNSNYKKAVRIPFENITIPVPFGYDAILKQKYGDYMKLVHTWDSHDYPFFDKQRDIIREKSESGLNEFKDTLEDVITFKEHVAILRGKRKVLKALDNKKKKKNVVFMPFKPEHWDAMDGLWREYKDREDVDVKVVSVPYYYKNYDGTVEQYSTSAEYPDYINVLSEDEYNYEKDDPDEIIIQNPYDGYNVAATIHPRYYVRNLLMHTDKLIYIPYFTTDEIDAQDMRADVSMNSYVTMPGVVYADEVILQSENIRKLYIRKLTGFFGEESRHLWENQLNSNGAQYLINDNNNPLRYNRIPGKWRNQAVRSDGSYKKIILYYISTNGVLEHKHEMFEKIGRTMDVFKQYKEDIVCLLAFENNMEEVLEGENSELLMDYQCALRKYNEYILGNGELMDAVKACDAFYGEAGAEAQMCRNANKPVMIENVYL